MRLFLKRAPVSYLDLTRVELLSGDELTVFNEVLREVYQPALKEASTNKIKSFSKKNCKKHIFRLF
jgi:hypothetical protein